jgi:hypothetical protein
MGGTIDLSETFPIVRTAKHGGKLTPDDIENDNFDVHVKEFNESTLDMFKATGFHRLFSKSIHWFAIPDFEEFMKRAKMLSATESDHPVFKQRKKRRIDWSYSDIGHINTDIVGGPMTRAEVEKMRKRYPDKRILVVCPLKKKAETLHTELNNHGTETWLEQKDKNRLSPGGKDSHFESFVTIIYNQHSLMRGADLDRFDIMMYDMKMDRPFVVEHRGEISSFGTFMQCIGRLRRKFQEEKRYVLYNAYSISDEELDKHVEAIGKLSTTGTNSVEDLRGTRKKEMVGKQKRASKSLAITKLKDDYEDFTICYSELCSMLGIQSPLRKFIKSAKFKEINKHVSLKHLSGKEESAIFSVDFVKEEKSKTLSFLK